MGYIDDLLEVTTPSVAPVATSPNATPSVNYIDDLLGVAPSSPPQAAPSTGTIAPDKRSLFQRKVTDPLKFRMTFGDLGVTAQDKTGSDLTRKYEKAVQGGERGFGQVVKEKDFFDYVPFVSSLDEMNDMRAVWQAANRVQAGGGSDDDQKLLKSFTQYQNLDTTMGGNVAEILTALPSFAGELISTSGFGSTAKKTVQEGVEKTVKSKLLGKIAGGIVGGSLQTLPAGATRIPANAVKRMMPAVMQDDANELVIENGEDLMPALLKGAGEQWVEVVSERSGGLLDELLKPVNKVAGNIAVKMGFINAIKKANPGKSLAKFKNVLKKAGWNGVFQESFEERVGEVGRAVLGLEEYKLPTLEQIGTELIAFSIPGTGIGLTSAGINKLAGKEAAVEETGVPEATGSKSVDELNRAFQAQEIDEGIYNLGNHLLSIDPNFDANSTLEVVNAVKLATPELIKAEGYDPKGGAYAITGKTTSKFEEDNVQTAIQLYKGSDADTLVEEWYHRFYDRLSAEERSEYDEYHKGTKDKRKVNEHFAQEGRDFFFSEKLHEKAGGLRGIFAKARESLKALVVRVRGIRGAKIADNIQNIYKAAGTQQAGVEGVEGESYQIREGVFLSDDTVELNKTAFQNLKDSELKVISKEMRSKGYDFRGAKDARELMDKRRFHTYSRSNKEYDGDMANAIIKALDLKVKKQKEKYSSKLIAEVKKNVKKEFETTDDFNKSGYMLEDGTLLDFSEGQGMRVQDHRAINEIAPDIGIWEFIDMGNIRMSPESKGVDIFKKPTSEQYSKLREYIEEVDGEFIIDLQKGKDSLDKFSEDYDQGTSSEKIITDIKNFYAGEKIMPKSRILESRSYQLKKINREKYENILKGFKKKESDSKRLAYRLSRLPDEVQADRLALELELGTYENGPRIEDIISEEESRLKDEQRYHPAALFKGKTIYVPENYRTEMRDIIAQAPGRFTFKKGDAIALDVAAQEMGEDLNGLIAKMEDAIRAGYFSENDIKQKAIDNSLNEIKALKAEDTQRKIDWLSEFAEPGADVFIKNLSDEDLTSIMEEDGIQMDPKEVRAFMKADPGKKEQILVRMSKDQDYQVTGQKTLVRRKSEALDKMRSLIIAYARKSGLTGEPFDTVATMVKDTKSYRSMVRALDKIDEKVEQLELRKAKANVRKIIKKEKKRIRGLKGKKRGKIDAAYNDKLEEYITQFDYIPEKAQKRMQKSLEYFEDKNNEGEILPDEIKENAIRLTRQNIDNMSLEDLNEVIENINQIKKLGRLKYEIRTEREKAEIKEKAEQSAKIIRDYAAEKGKTVKTPLERTFEEDNTVQVVGKKLAKYFISNLRPERLLGSFAGFRKTPLIDYLHKNLLGAENTKFVNVEKATKSIQEIHSGIDLDKLNRELLTAEVPIGKKVQKIKVTFDKAMAIYAYNQSETGQAHLLGSGMTEEFINKVVNTLPTTYKGAVDKMIDYYDEFMYPRLNEEFKREHGVSLPKIERYFPLKLLDTPKGEDGILQDLVARFGSAAVEKGFTKARTGSKARFKKINYIDTMVQNVMAGEHYLAFNQPLTNAKRMLNNEDLKAAMEGYSEEGTAQLQDWLKAVARGRVETPPDHSGINKFLDTMRKNYALSVLGLNVVTMMKQPASFVQGLAQVNKGEAVKASLTFWSNPIKTNAFIDSKSPMMRNRASSFEREMAEMAEKRSSKTVLGKSSIKDLREMQMLPIQIADKITTDILWFAKYNEVMVSKGIESQAIQEADEVIRKTQPMGGILHLSALHRGGGVTRMFTMFTNQLNQNANLLYELGKTWGVKPNKQRFAELALYGIIPGLIIYLASNGFDMTKLFEDPEGAVKAIAMNAGGGFPFLNTVLDTSLQAIGNASKEAKGLPKQRIFTDMTPGPVSIIEDVLDAIAAKGAKKKLLRGVEAGLKLTGVATAQPKRAIKGFEAFQKTGDPRNLIWSKYALQTPSSQKRLIRRKILR